ncbi:MAG TPA: hypothetical protein VLX61_12865 [Anaerolineales bacterium]|nr:hypothetical protein [Anaerolineales bacterium]
MHVGMLWFDDSPGTSLKNKIEKAVVYYRQKYRREPNLCLIHPTMIERNNSKAETMGLDSIAGLTVRPYRPVLPGHLWIGVEDKG